MIRIQAMYKAIVLALTIFLSGCYDHIVVPLDFPEPVNITTGEAAGYEGRNCEMRVSQIGVLQADGVYTNTFVSIHPVPCNGEPMKLRMFNDVSIIIDRRVSQGNTPETNSRFGPWGRAHLYLDGDLIEYRQGFTVGDHSTLNYSDWKHYGWDIYENPKPVAE